jgi:hypothetical protein
MMAYQIPIWTVQLIMPIGFAVIALRLLWNASDHWGWRLAALVLAGGLAGIGLHPFVAPERLVMPGLIGLLAAVILGAPIFALLGGVFHLDERMSLRFQRASFPNSGLPW